jgi:hypothetical protein
LSLERDNWRYLWYFGSLYAANKRLPPLFSTLRLFGSSVPAAFGLCDPHKSRYQFRF